VADKNGFGFFSLIEAVFDAFTREDPRKYRVDNDPEDVEYEQRPLDREGHPIKSRSRNE
jgi:hypothetical protein